MENFKQDGSKYKSFTGSFSVQKSGNKWFIINNPNGITTTERVMFDGENVYTVWDKIQLDNNESNHQSSASTARIVNSNGVAYAKSPSAAIFSGEYPLGTTFTPRIIWYASGCFELTDGELGEQ